MEISPNGRQIFHRIPLQQTVVIVVLDTPRVQDLYLVDRTDVERRFWIIASSNELSNFTS